MEIWQIKMQSKKTILQFLCYAPRIYSGFDKYILLLSKKIIAQGYLPVIIYADTIKNVPQIVEDFEAIGAKVELISSSKGIMLRNIWQLYTKYKPAIVHSHFVNLVKIVTVLFSIIFGARQYISFHSTISLIPSSEYKKKKGILKRYLLLVYFRYLYCFSKGIFTVSKAILNQFLDFADKKKSNKVQKLYLGVEIIKNERTKMELREFLQLPQNKILLCNISAIEHIKGLDVLCEAIALLKTKYKLTNFACCHLGGLRADNEQSRIYRDSIYDLCEKMNIKDVMFWLGHRNDIGEILSAFDIYVHPSRMEGLGLVNVEAGIQSLPLVGSNVGGIPEVVQEGENGLLFDSDNAEQLAERLYKLINDEKLRAEMGQKSFEIVIENFSIETQTEKLINLYFE